MALAVGVAGKRVEVDGKSQLGVGRSLRMMMLARVKE